MISLITGINAVLLGIVASLSPCLFPVLPTFIAYLTNSEANRKQGLLASSLVTLGIMTVFVILATIYSSIISIIAPKYELFRTTQGIILIVLGLFLVLGLTVNWNFLNKLNSYADATIQKIDNPWLTSYLIGLFFTLLAAPCAIIVFTTAFTLIPEPTLITSILVMILFSLGAGLPFFIVGGLFPTAKEILLEKRGSIQTSITIFTGSLIILVGMYLTIDGLNLLPSLI